MNTATWAALSAIEMTGARVVQVDNSEAGNIVRVIIQWPGDEHPTEHRRQVSGDSAQQIGDVGLALDLFDYAASVRHLR